ncbi:MAG: hypothetical protein H0U27_01065 [Nitrosopumilus sp.]|nr:hypothetical protein [Nitrosopumilus sp.]
MKVQSFEHMRAVYSDLKDLEILDRGERNNLLDQYKYSVIIEGGHVEFDNLNTWIKQNITTYPIKEIYYGKTDYDYGFAEFFINDKIDEEKLKFAAQNIYTTWGNGTISKSDGSSISDIAYSTYDKDAIVYPYDENS